MYSLAIGTEVQSALRSGKPLVALESALITHGFSYPANLHISECLCEVIRGEGAVPAVIGIYHGQAVVGLEREQIIEIAADTTADKISIRDLPLTVLKGGNGGTTVAATAWLAYRAGLQVFATGGIGGIHRGHPEDVSADLSVLASTPIIVVCAGAKSILDLPRTLEYLETQGVPVLGWCTKYFPAFYSQSSGLPVDITVKNADEVAHIYEVQRTLKLTQGILLTVPVPEHAAIPNEIIEPFIRKALVEAEVQGISGKALTPFILERVVQLSDSKARSANESLLLNNAQIASRIACAMV